nr:DEAD/DEAH box helicase [uncultured Dethiosulfovibrio sp.]
MEQHNESVLADKIGLVGELYRWQREAYDRIKGRSAVLSAPTGTGKTWVAYLWAGLFDLEGKTMEVPQGEKVIFTAPIKALSNERYMDLISMGFDTGIETGDFKKNAEAPIVCCTQEIYALKYAGTKGIKLIVDEFHYIFGENDRSRAYIDGIRYTDFDVPILVMSATFGGSQRVRGYLNRITGRDFALYESHERVTELSFCDSPIDPGDVKDALVFVFSQKGAQQIADIIAERRLRFDESRRRRLEDLAWILEVQGIRRCMFKGVGVYHGSLLPKEKLLVERAYRERIIDVVVGTDALALGVNLPAERAVYAQLVKFHDRQPISKNAFLQMSGRAGRKGLFEKGYVTWMDKSPAEAFGVRTSDVFRALVKAPMEEASVELRPNFGAILKGSSTVENEANIVASGSLPELSFRRVFGDIKRAMKIIEGSLEKIVPGEKERFRAILADVWYGEMEVEQNLDMAELFFWGVDSDGYVHPDGITASEILLKYERNELQALLKVKRFNNALPQDYKLSHMDQVDEAIMDIDPTVFGFEEKIKEMDSTKVELPEAQHRKSNGGGRKSKKKEKHGGRGFGRDRRKSR